MSIVGTPKIPQSLLLKHVKEKARVIKVKEIDNISTEYREVYNVLSSEPIHINEICIKTKSDIGNVSSILTMLELNGNIEQVPGKMFKII